MTDQLTRALHDLAEGPQTPPVPASHELWKAGGRRRTRARLTAVAGLSAAALVAGLLLSPLGSLRTSVPAGPGEGVDTYPTEVVLPLWPDDVHDAHRRMVGVVTSPTRQMTYLVSATGGVWEWEKAATSPYAGTPSLSPDGRFAVAGVRLLDLVGGHDVRLDGQESLTQRFMPPTASAVWAPDSAHAVVPIVSQGRAEQVGLVVDTSGGTVAVGALPGERQPLYAGWLDSSTLLAYVVEVVIGTDRTSLVPWRWSLTSRRWAQSGATLALSTNRVQGPTLSPDGTRVVVVLGTEREDQADQLATFEVANGRQVGPDILVPSQGQCRPGWRGADVVTATPPVRTLPGPQPLVDLSARFSAQCVNILPAALAGTPVTDDLARWKDLSASLASQPLLWVLVAGLAYLLAIFRVVRIRRRRQGR